MTYTKQQWVDGQTKVDAQHLNHIEQGIYDISIQPGVPGEQGEPGKDGTTPLLKLTDSALQVSYDNGGQWSDLLPLSAITGPQGQTGEGFAIYKTYASIEAMQADAANVQQGKFVLISSTEDDPDNGKLYVKGETEFTYLSDLSGAQGIQGPQGEPGANGVTPVITINAKSVEATAEATVTKSGTDTNPIFEFSIPRGQDAELPDNLVTYSDFTYGDQQRKTIQLANYDSISGIGTDGQGYNIAMVSKWDKVDLGTPSLTMNLNSKEGIVQINDEKVVATTDQIPDVSGFATTEALTQGLADKQDKGDYALKSELPEIPETLPNPNALTIKYNGVVAFTYDGSKAETGNFMVNAQTVPVSDSDSKTIAQALSEKQAVGDYALTSDIPDVSGFATKIELTQGLEGKQAVGDYATNEIVEAEFASYDKTIKAYVDTELAKKQATGDYALKSEVPSIEGLATEEALTQGLATKTITVGHVGLNEDSVEIKQGESVVAQLTVPYYPLKVNASLFIDDGSFYDPEAGLGGHPDYFDNVKWSGGDSLTEEQLAKGPFLLITGTNTTTDEEGTTTLTNLVPLGKDSALGKVYATKEELETKANVDHDHFTLPISANIPLVTMQDKVYTEAEICGWFGAEDVTGLKGLMAQPHQFVIRYNISSGSLGYHSYQIPFQYLYVTANNKSLKGIAVGLNPNNDTVSKIVLQVNLDGTIIEGNSNVKVTYTSLE